MKSFLFLVSMIIWEKHSKHQILFLKSYSTALWSITQSLEVVSLSIVMFEKESKREHANKRTDLQILVLDMIASVFERITKSLRNVLAADTYLK